MGAVYKARQIDANRIIALKMLHDFNLDEDGIARFNREAKCLSALQHQHIVSFYHFGLSDKNRPFVALEYVPGKTLGSILRTEEYLAPTRAIKIFEQICKALKFAHDQGIVHRDLKPDNLMLLDKPEPDFVKLLDFGLAKKILSAANSSKLTASGVLMGTPAYMSPEQAGAKNVDNRSDIYSCACIFFRMLTGEDVFVADHPVALISKHLNEHPRSFAQTKWGGNCPAALEAICIKGLKKNPLDRYQNMDELIADLQLVNSGQEHLFATDRINSVSFARRGSKPFKLTIPLLCISAILLIGILLNADSLKDLFLSHKHSRIEKDCARYIADKSDKSVQRELNFARSLLSDGQTAYAGQLLKDLMGRLEKSSRTDYKLKRNIEIADSDFKHQTGNRQESISHLEQALIANSKLISPGSDSEQSKFLNEAASMINTITEHQNPHLLVSKSELRARSRLCSQLLECDLDTHLIQKNYSNLVSRINHFNQENGRNVPVECVAPICELCYSKKIRLQPQTSDSLSVFFESASEMPTPFLARMEAAFLSNPNCNQEWARAYRLRNELKNISMLPPTSEKLQRYIAIYEDPALERWRHISVGYLTAATAANLGQNGIATKYFNSAESDYGTGRSRQMDKLSAMIFHDKITALLAMKRNIAARKAVKAHIDTIPLFAATLGGVEAKRDFSISTNQVFGLLNSGRMLSFTAKRSMGAKIIDQFEYAVTELKRVDDENLDITVIKGIMDVLKKFGTDYPATIDSINSHYKAKLLANIVVTSKLKSAIRDLLNASGETISATDGIEAREGQFEQSTAIQESDLANICKAQLEFLQRNPQLTAQDLKRTIRVTQDLSYFLARNGHAPEARELLNSTRKELKQDGRLNSQYKLKYIEALCRVASASTKDGSIQEANQLFEEFFNVIDGSNDWTVDDLQPMYLAMESLGYILHDYHEDEKVVTILPKLSARLAKLGLLNNKTKIQLLYFYTSNQEKMGSTWPRKDVDDCKMLLINAISGLAKEGELHSDWTAVTHTILRITNALIDLKQPKQAMDNFMAAREIVYGAASNEEKAEFCNWYLFMYKRSNGSLDKKALVACPELDFIANSQKCDAASRSNASFIIAEFWRELHDQKKEREYLLKSIEQFERSDELSDRRYFAYANMSRIYDAHRQFKEGDQCLKRGLLLLKQLQGKDKRLIGFFSGVFSEHYASMQEKAKAENVKTYNEDIDGLIRFVGSQMLIVN